MFLSIALAFCMLANSTRASDSALRALILTGEGTHDWRGAAALLQKIMTDSGRFDVRICETTRGLTPALLAPFDLVVDDVGAGEAVDSFVRSGKGLVLTRHGFAGTHAKTESAFGIFELKSALPEHPVMQGLKTLRTGDQPLDGLSIPSHAEILATTTESAPLLFASKRGKGRVFSTALGHDVGAMQEKTYVTTFLRGAEWAASGKVTLPNEIEFKGPSTNGVRTLILNGGHDHPRSFYGLFEGYDDIGSSPVADTVSALQQDLRAKYDVLIFYDFTRDLNEKCRKNLRDFVESGKGILVLHHGILDFQKWPWWYEEVVGGLYRLERQGSIPNSSVKYGEEHLITPAGMHPITAGIGPFHVTDETYKGLYISENVKPLLYTDNQTSDKTVAWIGPCATSRVVFIQLGHDHLPFRHPSYRAIVHNSILWTAGKLN